MRLFYEKSRQAVMAKSTEEAQAALEVARVELHRLQGEAKRRMELSLHEDLGIHWANVLACVQHSAPKMKLFLWEGLNYVRREPAAPRSSLRVRWGERAEWPESNLPTVPLWRRATWCRDLAGE